MVMEKRDRKKSRGGRHRWHTQQREANTLIGLRQKEPPRATQTGNLEIQDP